MATVPFSAAQIADPGAFAQAPPGLALKQAALALAHLARDPAFLSAHVFPVLEGVSEAEGWYVAHRYDARDGSYSLQVFAWPPASGTRIHDHTSWGAFCCVVGSVLEERYERLDDGSRDAHARLKKLWRLSWSKEDGVSTLMPFDGGIHRVANPGVEPAISIHLYGPRIGELDGRDYDPSRNYVCGRIEG